MGRSREDRYLKATFSATKPQIEMIQHPAHIKIWACGRRWGKTVCMAIALTIAAIENPGCTVWYVSPRYARSLKMMRIMKKSAGFMELVRKPSMQFPPRFEMRNGSEICFISADREDELRGEGLRLICVDEAAILSKHLFYEVLMPMTFDSGGTIVAASTYNGRNWFYDLAEEGKKGDPDKKTWVYPTPTGWAFNGTDKKRANLERMKRNTPPMVWQQECMCEPLAMVDAVFQYVDQCVTQTPPRTQPRSGAMYVCAQDIGRIVDQSGIVVEDLETGEVVFSESYPLGMKHADQAARTKMTARFWNDALIVLDTTGGASGGKDESAVKEYKKVIPRFRAITFTQDTKRNMCNRLALDFETAKTRIPAVFNELVSQLKLYRYVFNERAIQPTFFGRPDDLVAAKMMCSWARAEGWRPDRGTLDLSRLMP